MNDKHSKQKPEGNNLESIQRDAAEEARAREREFERTKNKFLLYLILAFAAYQLLDFLRIKWKGIESSTPVVEL